MNQLTQMTNWVHTGENYKVNNKVFRKKMHIGKVDKMILENSVIAWKLSLIKIFSIEKSVFATRSFFSTLMDEAPQDFLSKTVIVIEGQKQPTFKLLIIASITLHQEASATNRHKIYSQPI